MRGNGEDEWFRKKGESGRGRGAGAKGHAAPEALSTRGAVWQRI
jgi:hypothetical protein